MAGQSPLRRWKPFFAAFGLVDAAIEAAGPVLCRDAIRSARGEVVQLLCGVPAGDARKAEELCVALDGFMAESLLTLQAVPAEAVSSVLASSADLPKAVGALRSHHQSARVRGLACDVARGWTAAVEGDVAKAKQRFDAVRGANKAKAAPESSRRPDVKLEGPKEEKEKMEAVRGVSKAKAAPEASRRADVKREGPEEEKKKMEAKVAPEASRRPDVKLEGPKEEKEKMEAVRGVSKAKAAPEASRRADVKREGPEEEEKKMEAKAAPEASRRPSMEAKREGPKEEEKEKLEATKRKLREGYRAAEDAKRQRKIQVIAAPKMVEERQRKMHPILRERSKARCGTSTAVVRRSLVSSFSWKG
ncbi:unnamed protein product [Urochloa humidicola]